MGDGSYVVPFMRILILFLFLLGCTYETTNIEAEEDMARTWATPEQWGQEKIFRAEDEWVNGQVRVVLNRDTPEGEFQNPKTSTLICGIFNGDTDDAQQYTLRWVLRMGTGGARTEVVFDANRFTRLSMPVEAFSLGLMLDADNAANPDMPAGDVSAFAYVGEGGIGKDQNQGPSYSQRFVLSAGPPDSQIFEIPEGACAFRISGVLGATGPFKTTFTATQLRGSTVLANIRGLGVAPGDPSLFTLFASGLWLPIVASPTAIQLAESTTVPSAGFIQYKLDL